MRLLDEMIQHAKEQKLLTTSQVEQLITLGLYYKESGDYVDGEVWYDNDLDYGSKYDNFDLESTSQKSARIIPSSHGGARKWLGRKKRRGSGAAPIGRKPQRELLELSAMELTSLIEGAIPGWEEVFQPVQQMTVLFIENGLESSGVIPKNWIEAIPILEKTSMDSILGLFKECTFEKLEKIFRLSSLLPCPKLRSVLWKPVVPYALRSTKAYRELIVGGEPVLLSEEARTLLKDKSIRLVYRLTQVWSRIRN